MPTTQTTTTNIQTVAPVIPAPYHVDITPVLQQNPYSPFSLAISLAVIIGAVTGLMKVLVPMLLKQSKHKPK